MEIAMVDDTIVPIQDAQISAHDRSVYFGDGVYEVLPSVNGALFELDRHMARLESSLRKMDMLDQVDLVQIRRRVLRAREAAEIPHATIYLQVTRGRALRSHDYGPDWQPGFLLTVRPRRRQQRESGTVITHPDWRWKRCDIKSLNLLANVLAKHAATQAGAYEAVLVDDNGLVTEGTSTSAMIVKDATLITAPLTANILPGVTRELVLEWAPDLGLEVVEKSFTVNDALKADELIITGTSTEVLGITQLDKQTIADGRPGQYARKLQGILTDAMQAQTA